MKNFNCTILVSILATTGSIRLGAQGSNYVAISTSEIFPAYSSLQFRMDGKNSGAIPATRLSFPHSEVMTEVSVLSPGATYPSGFFYHVDVARFGYSRSLFDYNGGIEIGYEQYLRRLAAICYPRKLSSLFPGAAVGKFDGTTVTGPGICFGINASAGLMSFNLHEAVPKSSVPLVINGKTFSKGASRINYREDYVELTPYAGIAFPVGKRSELRILIEYNLMSSCGAYMLFAGEQKVVKNTKASTTNSGNSANSNTNNSESTTSVKTTASAAAYLFDSSGNPATKSMFLISGFGLCIELSGAEKETSLKTCGCF